mmetsp:Transcript_26503/g.37854  ORF Transcript_26503/g.37854 Transcript_26503/m.37854 type:complete len:84 (-) Transcript_26503:99-350(-)
MRKQREHRYYIEKEMSRAQLLQMTAHKNLHFIRDNDIPLTKPPSSHNVDKIETAENKNNEVENEDIEGNPYPAVSEKHVGFLL